MQKLREYGRQSESRVNPLKPQGRDVAACFYQCRQCPPYRAYNDTRLNFNVRKKLFGKVKKIKAVEREQLSSGVKPTISHFWNQPNGVRLILIKKNVLDSVASVILNRTWDENPQYEQRIGKMTAYPAHVGTLLSRRRRGPWSDARACWFSVGWTIVHESIGGTVCTDDIQIPVIAKKLNALTIAVDYDCGGGVCVIQADADGKLTKNTRLTSVLTSPRGTIWDPIIVDDPTPKGLTKALLAAGFDINKQMLEKQEMMTILTIG